MLKNFLIDIKKKLSPICGKCSSYEAEQILCHVLNKSKNELYLNNNIKISNKKKLEINSIIKRRLKGEPLPYILGFVYFYSADIKVNKNVLIPRPETEVLVDIILKNEKNNNLFFIDICTGSGAILLVLCKERKSWSGIGTDISIDALKLAKENCFSYANSQLLACDMISCFKIKNISKGFDFAVCNPPYIAKEEISNLDISVRNYEPYISLYGGEDGLDYYRILAKETKNILKPDGRLYCEIPFDKKDKIFDIFQSNNWKAIRFYKDLQERIRIICTKI